MKNWNKFLPYIIAMVVFMVLPVIYFAPQYEGFDVRKFDNVQAKGMTVALEEHIDTYNEHPYWIANMFGGMPSYAVNLERTPDIVRAISSNFYFLGRPAAYYFMLAAGFFLMLILFGVNPYLAIVGAVAYTFSTYFIIIYEAGHIMKIVALIYAAPLVGALYYTYKKSFWVGAPLFGVFTLLEIASVHPQITYYFIIAMLIMVGVIAYNSYKTKALRRFFTASAALVLTTSLAVGANSVYLYYTQDYSSHSTRGAEVLKHINKPTDSRSGGLDKDYITAWSYGKMETFNLLIPNLMGGKSSGGAFASDGEVVDVLKKYVSPYEAKSIAAQLPAYWGPQPMTSGPVYIGAVMVFLFVLGLFIVRGTNLWWIVGATGLAIILAWGKNFMPLTDLFIDYFPLYSKFRTVSMILVVVELTVPLMAMLVLNKIWKGEVAKEQLITALKKSVYITGGVCVFFLVLGGSLFDFSSSVDGSMGMPAEVISAMQGERASLLRADAVRSLMFILTTAALIWLFTNAKVKKNIFVLALGALVLFDMIPVALRHLDHSMFTEKAKVSDITPMTAADKEILKDPDINYRVANLSVDIFNDATTSTYHRSVGGYFAAKPRRYQDFINYYLGKYYVPAYNMLNTKYFITKGEDSKVEVQYNPDAFGNAWVVTDVKYVNTPNEEIEAIATVGENLKTTAIVSEEFSDMIADISLDTNLNDVVEQTEYKANRMVYKSTLAQKSLVLFSEMYYPRGWTATIDGEPVNYLRANYLLNALVVPAGEHTIVFSFTPPHLSVLRGVATCSSLILVLLVVFGVVMQRREYKKMK